LRIIVLAPLVLAFTIGSAIAEEQGLPPLLVKSWLHDESGVRLNIDADGAFEIVAAGGAALSTGSVSCSCWDESDWVPGNYACGIVLRFEQGGKIWVVSGYSILGEGSPMGLTLFATPVNARWLFEPFGVTLESSKLVLRGPQP